MEISVIPGCISMKNSMFCGGKNPSNCSRNTSAYPNSVWKLGHLLSPSSAHVLASTDSEGGGVGD